ncbi:peptidoglycan DD-metalloendopeptidase family protein [Alphaproteobacteria bacterium]|jgi:septal ring factor EnvC (AmiA/AmiB activator)|nr:peptidoglycan DD-metalloendopeptidase family protein [Alphaproteobacteria bacterium]
MLPLASAAQSSLLTLTAVFAVLSLLFGAHESVAQKSGDLQKIEGEIAKDRQRQVDLVNQSKIIASELRGLRGQMIQTARAVQEQEAHMAQLEEKLNDLNDEARRRRTTLLERKRQMHGTLAAMERLARNPPHALLLAPGNPIQVVRSATLLRAAVPQIQTRARSLQEKIAALGRIQADILSQYNQLKTATDSLEHERRKMTELVTKKASLRQITNVEKELITKRVAQLTNRAKSLRDLFGQLRPGPPARGKRDRKNRSRPKSAPQLRGPTSIRTFPRRGGVTSPVRGRLAKAYGQNNGYGNTAKGITIAAWSGAQVVAPFDGKIVFAGPFRGYGKILIIEHRGGYHTLLAGMERVDGSLDQWILAGEPIGVMARKNAQKPRLYMELRRGGKPINPLPWVVYKSSRRRS